MEIEVSDLYDAFHQVAVLCWKHFKFPTSPNDIHLRVGLAFDDLMDYLEWNVFYAGCSRRIAKRVGIIVPPENIRRLLCLCDGAGAPFEGSASEYHGHAFDVDRPNNDNLNVVENILMGGDLSVWARSDVRLFVNSNDIEQFVGPERGQLVL
jgi:hypothetical protein